MLTFGILDDGVGIFPTYYKLRQVVSGNFIGLLLNDDFPLSRLSKQQLYNVGRDAVNFLSQSGCDVIAISSVALSSVCKRLSEQSAVPLYFSEAPVVHASMYTASNVLVCCENAGYSRQNAANALYCVMDDFPVLAQDGDERSIVDYIEQRVQPYFGQFDCIALASSSMNLYKNCFLRVCPNARVFDSLDGIARKIRKKYAKIAKDDGFCKIIDKQGANLTEKYGIFLE